MDFFTLFRYPGFLNVSDIAFNRLLGLLVFAIPPVLSSLSKIEDIFKKLGDLLSIPVVNVSC